MADMAVEPARELRLVHVAVDAPDPVYAQRIANAFGTAFIASSLERRVQASAWAGELLEHAWTSCARG